MGIAEFILCDEHCDCGVVLRREGFCENQENGAPDDADGICGDGAGFYGGIQRDIGRVQTYVATLL